MIELVEGWEVAASPPGACAGPGDLGELDWRPAVVPGTAAAAVGADGRDFDAEDWWFRTRFALARSVDDERRVLELEGIATVSEVFLNGERVLESSSMWATHAVDVTGRVREDNELVIVCRALTPLLAISRRPRQRWRTRVVSDGSLRWFRTMVCGRAPGWAPEPAAVGPWRPVRLVRRGAVGIDALSLRTRLDGDDGVVLVRARVRGAEQSAEAVLAGRRETLRAADDGWFEAELRVTDAPRWWPHTHGEPLLHELSVELAGETVATRRVGFRSLSWADDLLKDGLDLHVNGVPMFARGAVWTPADLISLAPTPAALRRLLVQARDAGMNMLRVFAMGAYESPLFHDLCDELGILVWQDLMFTYLDYPLEDPGFRAEAEREARAVLANLSYRPSLVVVAGNAEVEQQPAMLGLDPTLGRHEFWEETIPRIVAESGADCAYVSSTPCGGEMPFQPNRGISHFFGIGGYFRTFEDVRRADVRFAAECLTCANMPDEVEVPVYDPRWKAGVPRDPAPAFVTAPGFDFDDVRDFYLRLLFGVDPVELRRTDYARYVDLSRVTSGEKMAEVMGEWRREGSPCRGALVLWLKDMVPGAGFGVIDHRGEPKVSYYYLRRALAPVAVWTTDEGLNGVVVHVANDRPEPLRARLRVALYQNLEAPIGGAEELLELAPHGTWQRNVEGVLGRFVDSALAYGFGPANHDAVVVSLESTTEPSELLSQSFRFPAGRPLARESALRLGIEASADMDATGAVALTVRSRRLAYGVRVHTPGYEPDDNAFSVEPGGQRVVQLRPADATVPFAGGSVSALNLSAPVSIGAARS
jgi:beta-mannosidase